MKLAVSNIAWNQKNDESVLEWLSTAGVNGIEIAPTRIWPDWAGITQKSIGIQRHRFADLGFEIPALQAILYGKPELRLFRNQDHPKILDHIKRVADIASGLEAKVLVFGSARNRSCGGLPFYEAISQIKGLLWQIGEICADRGCCLGWEPNPEVYGCDFVNNVEEARQLLKAVNHPGVQLHLDGGALSLSNKSVEEEIRNAQPFVHYHISEPMLRSLSGGKVDHERALRALKDEGYDDWVSIEMMDHGPEALQQSVRMVHSILGRLENDPSLH